VEKQGTAQRTKAERSSQNSLKCIGTCWVGVGYVSKRSGVARAGNKTERGGDHAIVKIVDGLRTRRDAQNVDDAEMGRKECSRVKRGEKKKTLIGKPVRTDLWMPQVTQRAKEQGH